MKYAKKINGVTIKGGQTTLGYSVLILEDPAYYDVQPGTLLKTAILMPDTDATLRLGTTNGGEEIMPDTDVTEDRGETVELNIFAVNETRRVYFGGLPIGSTVAIILIDIL